VVLQETNVFVPGQVSSVQFLSSRELVGLPERYIEHTEYGSVRVSIER